jgi:RNA polymerase sigma factor (sigma-70 family)
MTRLTAQQLSAVKLRDALRSEALDDLPDAGLLERFARYAEHSAFEVLLRRHGPMVFGVCRRVLANRADAEDAFQATFLVLVRKAKSVRSGDRLGPWLYGVAFRVAMKARARAARIAARRTEATDMIPDPTSVAEIPDWLPILDAELNALPEKYREPLVLCELQGASRVDAAKALHIPEGTLSSRLARGRELLRRRLLKHGTLLPAGGLAALFTGSGVGRASVPAGLFAKTSELAVVMTRGAALAGVVPAGPAQLMDEVLKSMFLTKLRVAGGVILAAGLMACGLLAALPGEAPAQPEKVADAKASRAQQETAPPSQKDFRGAGQELRLVEFTDGGTVVPDREAIQGLWAVEKLAVGKQVKPDELKEMQDSVGKMRFLIAGDVWWGLEHHGVYPQQVKLDSSKNPRWIDMGEAFPGAATKFEHHGIYELHGDMLQICMCEGGEKASRPAEFATDGDSGLIMMSFRREKVPPAVGEKILNGSWENPVERIGAEKGKMVHTPIQRVEFVNGYLFALIKEGENNQKWLGGRYTVDATKNPAWIDVDLVAPFDDKVKATKLYGCYELADGQLKLALGRDGKRTFRPLEFKRADNVLYFDVKATKEPLGMTEKVIREDSPRPKPAVQTPKMP